MSLAISAYSGNWAEENGRLGRPLQRWGRGFEVPKASMSRRRRRLHSTCKTH